MADNWYIFDGTRQLGPLSLRELSNLLDIQRLSDVHVWREGLAEWVSPGDLPELTPRPPPLPIIPENRNAQADAVVETNKQKGRRYNNFVAMNWRGEFSIGITYWIFGFLANLLAGILAAIIVATFRAESGYEPRSIFFTIFFVWLVILAISIWQTIGVWRSANRHIAQRATLNKRSPWAGLAKLAVIIGVFRISATFLTTGWPQLLETGRMSFWDDPDIPSYSMRVMRDGTEAEITGGIKYGLTDDFSKILKASRQIKIVHLDSIGGRIGEAEKLGALIGSNNIDTYVSAKCLSACTIVFAAGAHRVIREGAKLGFHAPAFPGMSQNELADSANEQKAIFSKAGFDRKFIERALSTPNSEMWTPTSDVLLQAGAVTSVSDGTDYAISGLGGSLTRSQLASMLTQNLPLMAILKSKYPADYETLVQAYYDGFASGRTEAEWTAAGRANLEIVLKKLRPLADDSVLSKISTLFADQYEALGTKSPILCYRYASGVDADKVSPFEIPEPLRNREIDIDELVVNTANIHAQPRNAPSEDIWKKVGSQVTARGIKREQFDLLTADTVIPSQYADYCFVVTTFFREISRLPQNEAGIIMRQVLMAK